MHELSTNHATAAESRIVRNLESAADYQPNWRARIVERYVSEHAKASDRAAKLAELLTHEKDDLVRLALQYHCGTDTGDASAIGYAVSCDQEPVTAWAIKAMVVAKMSSEEIAEKVGTTASNVECFERLYFDTRRYLNHRVWLRGVCYGKSGHRWLQVAFNREAVGVKEIVLRQKDATFAGRRDERGLLSVLHGRAEDYCVDREARNIPPGEDDLEMVERVCDLHSHAAFAALEDVADNKPSADSAHADKLKKLNAGGRERILAFQRLFIRKLEEQALELEQQTAAKIAADGNSSQLQLPFGS